MRFQPLLLALLLVACGVDPEHDHADHDHDHDTGGHAHVHTAPHGGALVQLGNEALHVEFVLDQATGELTAYVLDGEAEGAVRLAEPRLTVSLMLADALDLQFTLEAVANELTGETVGDTSEFRGTLATLAGVESFEAVLEPLEARGVAFAATAFRYPEGNE